MNDHTTEYLNYFVMSEKQNFAVLINGKWGSGKTWYVREYLRNYDSEINNLSISVVTHGIYVSLNGVSKPEEIDKKIFLSLHPNLDSKYSNLIGHLACGLMSFTGTNKLISGFEYIDFNHAVDNKRIIVFDDLERCQMRIEEILGYINEFVENRELKVIIVANEGEITLQNNKYISIKEKLIGKTLEIRQDVPKVVEYYLSEVKHRETKIALKNNLYLIEKIYHQSKSNNLRALKYLFYDFERFCHLIDLKYFDNLALFENLVRVYYIFGLEVFMGSLSAVELAKFKSARVSKMVNSNKKSLEGAVVDAAFEKYDDLKNINTVISDQLWSEWFSKGHINRENLNSAIEKSDFIIKENPNWVKLWRWYEFFDFELMEIIQQVEAEISEHKITSPAVILHIGGALLNLHKLGIYKNKGDEKISEELIIYIENLGERLENIKLSDLGRRMDSWGGLVFQENESSQFQKILNKIVAIIDMREKTEMAADAETILESISGDLSKFWKDFTFSNNGGKFSFKPVLKYLSAKQFFLKILELRNDRKDDVFYILQKRYENIHSSDSINDELVFLENLLEEINSFLSAGDMTISRHTIGLSKNERLLPTIESLKRGRISY
jgi:KAP family P-loop domain